MTTEQKIKDIMSTVLEVPVDQINEDSSTDTLDNWDSLHHLNLVLALEEEFNISIPDEEVGNIVNFKKLSSIINGLLG